VADGRAMVVGRAVVDRRQTLHVRETIHFPRPKPPAGISLPKSVKLPMPPPLRVDTWLDALTSEHGDAISFQSARIVLSRSGCTQS